MGDYCKVLIVDDEFIMRQGMKHMLEWEKEGFQIVGEASNGQEGLVLVEELKPDIVLADIVMPIIDGIEFSKILGKKYPSIQLIILSSYDKFEYVKTTLLNGAADYVLKPTLNPDILLKVLKKAVSRIPGMKLLTQQEVPYASQVESVLLGFQEKLNEVTFAQFFSNTLYRLIAVDLRKMCGGNGEDMLSCRQTLEEFYEGKSEYVSLPVFLNESILCFVLNYRVKDELAIVVDAESAASSMQRIYQNTFLVMSRNFSGMQEIHQYYQQDILKEIGNTFYNPGRHFMVIEKYEEPERIIRFEFENYTAQLAQGRYEEALEMFENYITYLCEKQVEEDKLKNLSKNLLYNFLMEIEKMSVESESLRGKYFTMLDTAIWVTDFQDIVQKITKELRQILQWQSGGDNMRIQEIKQYAQEHYQEPLELSDIADKFGFSYHYLSSYFRQNTNEGFNEFLNKIRVRHACELLNEGNISIAEVGNQVGYSDHSYFCRVFKKISGDTPSNYRRRTKRGEL